MHDLLPDLKEKKLLLASGSPRRRELLKAAGFCPELIQLKEVDESLPVFFSENNPAEYLARRKAECYVEEIGENDLLLAADTVVCLGQEVLGKPSSRGEAVDMLRKLSGKKHKVITGVALYTRKAKVVFSDCTFVYFKSLIDSEIDYYVNRYKPFDKAGAYGIQEWIGLVGVEKLEGCYFNVMGLPVAKLFGRLQTDASFFCQD